MTNAERKFRERIKTFMARLGPEWTVRLRHRDAWYRPPMLSRHGIVLEFGGSGDGLAIDISYRNESGWVTERAKNAAHTYHIIKLAAFEQQRVLSEAYTRATELINTAADAEAGAERITGRKGESDGT